MDPNPRQGDGSRRRVIEYPGRPAAAEETVVVQPSAKLEPQVESGPAEPAPPLIRPNPRDGWSTRKKALAGIGAAVALGVGAGALLMPRSEHAGASDRAMAAATASRDADDHLQIEVHRRAPPTQPVRTAGGKIDAASTVMEPSGAGAVASSAPQAAEKTAEPHRGIFGVLGRLFGGRDDHDAPSSAAPSQSVVPAQPVQVEPRPVQVVRQQVPRPAPVMQDDSSSPAVAPAAQPQPQASFDRGSSPSFDCRYARSRSEQMVCQEPALAAADRRMARAYADARRAGLPSEMLKAQQQRWYRARDRAAFSPSAVGAAYEQRIAELEALRQRASQGEDVGETRSADGADQW